MRAEKAKGASGQEGLDIALIDPIASMESEDHTVPTPANISV